MPLNLANTVTITAKTAYANVTTVSSNVITNAVASNQIYKINNISLTNYTSTSVTANVITLRNGVGTFNIINTIAIPANSLLTVLAKDTSLYLEEGDTIQTNSSANSSIHLSVGYEILS
jgi:hypothetical protein